METLQFAIFWFVVFPLAIKGINEFYERWKLNVEYEGYLKGWEDCKLYEEQKRNKGDET